MRRSTSSEQLLQRLLETGHVVDDGQRNLVLVGNLSEQPVGIAVVADDEPMGAGRSEVDELVRQRVAALLSAQVQHHDRNAAALCGVAQVTGAGELVLDGDAGVAEALEARADREE